VAVVIVQPDLHTVSSPVVKTPVLLLLAVYSALSEVC
jgi:hypothetical protein